MYGKHLSHLICRGRESFDVVPAVFCGVCFGEKGLPIQNASGNEIHFSWYNNCYSLSLNVISLKLIFIVIPFHLKQSLFFFFLVSLPFNKCLIFHYFIFPRLIFFLFSLFIICLFSSASLFVFFSAHILSFNCCCCYCCKSTRKHIKKPFGFDWLLFLGAYSFWVKSEHNNNNNDYQKCFSPLHSTSRCTFCTRFHKQLMAMKRARCNAMLRITICQRTSMRSLYFASSCK